MFPRQREARAPALAPRPASKVFLAGRRVSHPATRMHSAERVWEAVLSHILQGSPQQPWLQQEGECASRKGKSHSRDDRGPLDPCSVTPEATQAEAGQLEPV